MDKIKVGIVNYLVLGWVALIPTLLHAQEYSYANYNIREGLAGSVVYCMAQDHDGYMWFGTETGLSRYDGTRFKNFTVADGLPDNEILRIFVDSKNRVWIVPFKNALCYYWKGKLHTVENDSLLKKMNFREGLPSIAENDKGEIAIAARFRVVILHPDDGLTAVKGLVPDVRVLSTVGVGFDRSFYVSALELGKDLLLWKVAGDSLVFWEDISQYKRSSINLQLLDSRVRIYYKQDSLFLSTPGNKYRIPAPDGVTNACVLNDSLAAITSMSETFTYNFIRGKIDRIFFRGKNLTSAYEDREGNLWFSSFGDGVYRLPSTDFVTWSFPSGANNLPVYCLQKRRNSLLVGTDHFSLWSIEGKNSQPQKSVVFNGFSQGRITVIEERNGDLLLGTDVGLFEQIKEEFKKSALDIAIKSIHVYGDSLIIGTSGSAFAVGILKDSLYQALLSMRTNAVHKQGNLFYLGTLGGLYIGNDKDKPRQMGSAHPAFNSRISSIEETADGTVWIGTFDRGVVGYKNGKVIAELGKKNGLTSDIIRTIFTAGNTVWLGTERGLNKVEPWKGTFKITRYTAADGLASDMINAVYADGRTIYVGTPIGLTRFEEDRVFTRSMCLLQVSRISSARQQSIDDSSHLVFDHFDTDLRFEFSGISFKSPGEIIYRHRLTDIDTAWRITSENFLNYPTLPSGEYTLAVQAENKFGVRSNIIHLRFTVKQLLWEKTWFRIAAIIFIAALLWIFISYRIQKIRRQEQERLGTMRKMAELEQMALRAQMNPHFIFNCLNSIQHYVFKTDIRSANRFITGFSKLIRMTMEIATKETIRLEEEIKFLSAYLELEKNRFENKFVYHINVDEAIDPAEFFIPTLILQPYVENSIRHGIRPLPGNNGIIKIDFVLEKSYLLCSVEDNGIGRKRAQQLKGDTAIEYQSKGMTLTAKRIEMLNKNLSTPILLGITDIWNSDEAAGTKVIIRIPLQNTQKPFSGNDTRSAY